MKSKEYSSYIKGLIEGANLDLTTPEGKVLSALTELAGQMADEIDALTAKVETCNAYIEEIDEDLGAVEEVLYGEDGCDCCGEDEDDCDDCDCCCGEDDEKDDDEEYYCAMCPNCGGKIFFDDSVNPEDIICPSCQKPLVDDDSDLEEIDGDEE